VLLTVRVLLAPKAAMPCPLRRVLIKRGVTPVSVVHREPQGEHTKNSEPLSNTKEDMEVSELPYLSPR